MLNKKYCCFFIGITIIIIGLLIQFYLLYNANNKNKLYLYDAKLMYAASAIKEHLPENYHYKDMDKNSYTTKETLELFKELHKLSQKLEVDYIYTMYMGKNGKIYYTSSSDSLEDDSDGDTITYWYSLTMQAIPLMSLHTIFLIIQE